MNKYLIILPIISANFSAIASAIKTDIIEQITVTATRSDSQLLVLERNLSVINNQALSLVEHEHINQAMVRVPGGWISRGNGQEHLTAIRSPVLTGAGGCGAFFIAQDGIALRAPGFCNTNQLFDANTEQAERIEVLRGPASTLYGSNAVHGVVNVLTPNPLEGFDTQVGLTFGPHDYLRGNFNIGQVSDKQALQVYGNATHDGGYKNDSGFAQQKLNVVHQYKDGQLAIKSVVAATNLNQETAGFIEGFEAYKDSTLKRENPNPEAFRDSQSFRAYSQINYTINNDENVTFTPYFRWADMQFLQHFLPWQSLEKNTQKSVGFQSQYEKNYQNITWLMGLDVDASHGELNESQADDFSPTIPAGEHYDYDVNATVYSPFTSVLWSATEDLQVSAGLRYEFTEYDYENLLTDGDACADGVENCRFTRPEDQTVDYDEFSYQLGANYRFANNQHLYSQFSTGYRAPQATELFRLQAGQNIADLDAEQIDSIELGVRGQWHQLAYDVAIFTMKKDNFIFQDSNRQNISNGETSHQGLEFTLAYQLPMNFYLSATGTLAKHEYDSALTLSRENIQGNEIDTAPEHMGSVQFGWKEQGQQVELEWVHLGNYYLNPENTAEYSGHNLVNLRSSIELTEQFTISARVLNLADEDYAERADFGFGSHRYFVGEPRSFYMSLNYKFK